MSNKIKRIQSVFLILAGLLLVAHMVVPHDHHMTVSEESDNEECPVNDPDAKHHSGFPPHCHAFNDITSEKPVIYILKYQVNVLDACGFSESILLDLRNTSCSVFAFVDPFPEPYHQGLSQLRAPPFVG